MPLRYKINLITLGMAGMLAIFLAIIGNIWLALLEIGIMYFNWHVVMQWEKEQRSAHAETIER